MFGRIDLHVEVPDANLANLALPPPAEGSAEIAGRFAAARALPNDRYAGEKGAAVRASA